MDERIDSVLREMERTLIKLKRASISLEDAHEEMSYEIGMTVCDKGASAEKYRNCLVQADRKVCTIELASSAVSEIYRELIALVERLYALNREVPESE